MKKMTTIGLVIAMALSCAVASAQSSALIKADKDMEAFVAQHGMGTSNAALYESLYSAYRAYLYAVKNEPANQAGLAGLRKVYPYMIDGAVYFSQNNSALKALDYALAYINIPKMQVFRKERFGRSDYYPTICYFAATTAYNNKRFDDAINCFKSLMMKGTRFPSSNLLGPYSSSILFASSLLKPFSRSVWKCSFTSLICLEWAG